MDTFEARENVRVEHWEEVVTKEPSNRGSAAEAVR